MLICVLWRRFSSVRTAANLPVLHLSISALLMNSPIVLFLTNLYHQGPYLGEMGAKVIMVITLTILPFLFLLYRVLQNEVLGLIDSN